MLQQQGRIEIASGARALVISPTPAFLVGQMGELIKRVADGPRGQDHLEQARLLFETGLAWQAAQNATDRGHRAPATGARRQRRRHRQDRRIHPHRRGVPLRARPDRAQSRVQRGPRDPGRVADRPAHDDHPHARRRQPLGARSHRDLRGRRGARAGARIPRDGQPSPPDQPPLQRGEAALRDNPARRHPRRRQAHRGGERGAVGGVLRRCAPPGAARPQMADRTPRRDAEREWAA